MLFSLARWLILTLERRSILFGDRILRLRFRLDHVVALSDSWQKGAQQLSLQERTNLANDPRNLIPVDGPTNAKKSDSDAASWLPPNKAYRCTYVSKQITVKSVYRLWVTQAEKDAMSAVLSAC